MVEHLLLLSVKEQVRVLIWNDITHIAVIPSPLYNVGYLLSEVIFPNEMR